MEPLFTERQWRAIAQIEGRSKTRRYIPDGVSRKKLIGRCFVDGDFILLKTWEPLQYGEKPPAPKYAVIEMRSGLHLTWFISDRARVVEAARERIEAAGERWPAFLAKAQAEMAEWLASKQAEAAIRKAKKNPRKISKRARAVFEASNGKCHYCGTVLTLDGKWHIEHKMPRALFGGSEQANLAASCTTCNHRKRDKTDLEFRAQIAAQATN